MSLFIIIAVGGAIVHPGHVLHLVPRQERLTQVAQEKCLFNKVGLFVNPWDGSEFPGAELLGRTQENQNLNNVKYLPVSRGLPGHSCTDGAPAGLPMLEPNAGLASFHVSAKFKCLLCHFLVV